MRQVYMQLGMMKAYEKRKSYENTRDLVLIKRIES